MPTPPRCERADPDAPVAITNPVEGAHFILEPHRPATLQRPLMTALPEGEALYWTIDGEPADRWVPRPGTHRVEVARGESTDAVTITYE